MHNPHSVILRRHEFICDEIHPKPLIEQAHANGSFESEEEASIALDGLLQWLALPSYCAIDGFPPVMMAGAVAKMFDCLAADSVFYDQFCQRYLGHTLHAIPLKMEFQQRYVSEQRWIQSTWLSLNHAFGADLAPVLHDWPKLKRDSDIVFVGMFPDQLHRHHKLVPEQMLQEIWRRRPSRQVENHSLQMTWSSCLYPNVKAPAPPVGRGLFIFITPKTQIPLFRRRGFLVIVYLY